MEAKITSSFTPLVGMIDEGSTEGVFKGTGCEYTGQFKDGRAHGKGVLKREVFGSTVDDEYSGDWDNDESSGFGEFICVYKTMRGQMRSPGSPLHGYGEQIDSTGKYQGKFTDGSRWGYIRHTAPDGTVKDCMWKYDKVARRVKCRSEFTTNNAEQGVPL